MLIRFYLENTKESDIGSYQELKSYDLIFINGILTLKNKSEIKEKLFIDLPNYYYEYKQNHQSRPYTIKYYLHEKQNIVKSLLSIIYYKEKYEFIIFIRRNINQKDEQILIILK